MINKKETKVKIIDFGISHEYNENVELIEDTDCGTCRYMAPEQSRGKFCLKTDIWAFGCVLLELCTGHPPYHNVENDENGNL